MLSILLKKYLGIKKKLMLFKENMNNPSPGKLCICIKDSFITISRLLVKK